MRHGAERKARSRTPARPVDNAQAVDRFRAHRLPVPSACG
ncbi:hypothetical protein SLNWT_3123 [Streptomyces albus]|uniref:Uncharacterized protein n=1 Tax=Streptomyces albus (strain ATCC 21838 / DSM 41398 / FERM P-419 / JCM 4703 / NBRC 107858) TaxID=1081613 RepID=A0A0B5EPJ9_STRA4|nr:hypothetical protein SLNWT_3123 [Streptomyces albus]AYN33567.1 hypothetical protein DUI70_3066 [Streptomyces albus]